MLSAIALSCADAPLESLEITPTLRTHFDHLDAAQLYPLIALQQLRSLTVSGLDSLDHHLTSTLRHLTALTELSLAMPFDSEDGYTRCEVFEIAPMLSQLEVLCVTGDCRAMLQRLPDALASLTRLRRLEVHNIKILHTSNVLTALTALET